MELWIFIFSTPGTSAPEASRGGPGCQNLAFQRFDPMILCIFLWRIRWTTLEPDRPDQTGVTSAEQRLPIMDHGSRIMDQRSKIKDHGSRIMDHGSKIMDHGSRILDLGPCSGMNDHPGRDTDVRSRPSESTIKDLSFYLSAYGNVRTGPSSGACLG